MLEDQLLAIGWLYVALLLLVKQLPLEGQNSGVRSTPRASAREDMRRNFCAAANFKYQRGYRSRNSGVRSCRSCRIREQGLNPKIQDQHLPGKILAKLPDSLAPELLQLLSSWLQARACPRRKSQTKGVAGSSQTSVGVPICSIWPIFITTMRSA